MRFADAAGCLRRIMSRVTPGFHRRHVAHGWSAGIMSYLFVYIQSLFTFCDNRNPCVFAKLLSKMTSNDQLFFPPFAIYLKPQNNNNEIKKNHFG